MFSRLTSLTLKKGDWRLFIIPVLLTLFGLLMIYEASSVMAIAVFDNPNHFFHRQALWFGVALGAFLVAGRINLSLLRRIAPIVFLANLVLLILVLIPGIGIEIMGGRRWLNFGGFNFQPSELMKVSLALYLASLLNKSSKSWVFGLIIGLVGGLLIMEPDMGTMLIIIGAASCIYFVSGVAKRQIALLAGMGIVAVFALVVVSPYRTARLTTYLNPSTDNQGASYHSRQIQIALGNGGWLGQGLGKSRQKYLYIPEVTTDSIFAVVAEEFGFVGVTTIIAVYGYYISLSLRSLARLQDRYLVLFGVGLVASIALQLMMNLGAVSALIPLTGVPLPFISYGGTALVINFICAGLIYNISKQT